MQQMRRSVAIGALDQGRVWMAPVTCLLFAAVLAPLGALMCLVTFPMIFERAGAPRIALPGRYS